MRQMQWRSLIWLVKPLLLINRSKSKKISMSMDVNFLPDTKRISGEHGMPPQPTAAPHWSGLGLLAGMTNLLTVLVRLCLAIQKPFPCCIMSLKLHECGLRCSVSLNILVTYPFYIWSFGIILQRSSDLWSVSVITWSFLLVSSKQI